MRDVELYQQLLGLVAPWTVGCVELSVEGERVDIRAIAMDMWPPYISSTLRHVPGARDKIVFDPCHIMSNMNEAVDEVREARASRAPGPGR